MLRSAEVSMATHEYKVRGALDAAAAAGLVAQQELVQPASMWENPEATRQVVTAAMVDPARLMIAAGAELMAVRKQQ